MTSTSTSAAACMCMCSGTRSSFRSICGNLRAKMRGATCNSSLVYAMSLLRLYSILYVFYSSSYTNVMCMHFNCVIRLK